MPERENEGEGVSKSLETDQSMITSTYGLVCSSLDKSTKGEMEEEVRTCGGEVEEVPSCRGKSGRRGGAVPWEASRVFQRALPPPRRAPFTSSSSLDSFQYCQVNVLKSLRLGEIL